MDKKRYAILILAAGSSSRLGRPKQLVSFNNTNLLNHTIAEALKVDSANVYLVLGCDSQQIKKTIKSDLPVFIHSKWKQGFGSSVAFGVQQIQDSPYEAIIISVCDQPFLRKENFDNLLSMFEKGEKSIVISRYKNGNGPPTLFSKEFKDELLTLKGDQGAKGIVMSHKSNVGIVNFDEGDFDIDSQQDLDILLNQHD